MPSCPPFLGRAKVRILRQPTAWTQLERNAIHVCSQSKRYNQQLVVDDRQGFWSVYCSQLTV